MVQLSLTEWIDAVGGLDAIYAQCLSLHSNNHTQLRETGRHMEWLIGKSCLRLGMDASYSHPDFRKPVNSFYDGCFPLCPDWWAGWSDTSPDNPINQIAQMLSDRPVIQPYMGKITYIGYGEDCGDDVRQNLKDWVGGIE